MKITRDTDEQLILDHIPWVLSIGLALLVIMFIGIGLLPLGQSGDPMMWLFSGMFIVVGGGLWLMALGLFAKRLQFIFDRNTDRIRIRRRSIFKHSEITHKLSRLVEARIETDFGKNGRTLHRPVLILSSTSNGKPSEARVPLHDYFTNGPGPEAMVEAVNRWLARR
ncbi:hypothetical protein [Roseovarius sp. 2305UL8-3]|uniref:hypothetical protein n=1 Tax=Roseovarius conchicola TaxID=3121636 RepID=UPI0035298B16